MAMDKSVKADGADSASEHDDSTEASTCSDEEEDSGQILVLAESACCESTLE